MESEVGRFNETSPMTLWRLALVLTLVACKPGAPLVPAPPDTSGSRPEVVFASSSATTTAQVPSAGSAQPAPQPALASGSAPTLLGAPNFASTPSTALDSFELPEFVNVEVRQALIGPTKMGGAPWDGPGHIEPQAISAVSLALEAPDPYTAVLSAFANPIIAGLEKPEPKGSVRAVSTDGTQVLAMVELRKMRDTITPLWSEAFLRNVPLNPSVRVEITLTDEDFSNDDPIGAATIRFDDLVAALHAGSVYHVPIADQTHRQALFVDLSVYPAG
jgi:hypothetical protein